MDYDLQNKIMTYLFEHKLDTPFVKHVVTKAVNTLIYKAPELKIECILSDFFQAKFQSQPEHAANIEAMINNHVNEKAKQQEFSVESKESLDESTERNALHMDLTDSQSHRWTDLSVVVESPQDTIHAEDIQILSDPEH